MPGDDILQRLLPPEGEEPVFDTFGLLREPGGLVLPQHPAARPLGGFTGQALVILGEPGSGKSRLLAARADELRASGRPVLLVDLGAFGSDDRLERALVEAPTWQDWLAADDGRELDLMLDGFDEARLRTTTVGDLVAQLLGESPAARLRLLVCCRAGLWPLALDDRLADIEVMDQEGSQTCCRS